MSKLNKTISQIWLDDYVVPLYQRNYAWQESQIQQLLQDIYDNSKVQKSNYFIGSLVVLQRPDGIYEVIDGQQRLTTLHIICKTLNLLDAPHLAYDSRPEVEEFFRGLFASATSNEYAEECKKKDSRKIYRLVEAIEIVESTAIHTHPGFDDDRTISLSSMDDNEKLRLKEYLNNNVIVVRTVLPSDTDVAAYFEIMNNRGEQLQEHEIVKALMMKKLNADQRMIFSSVWDACSQMGIAVQTTLSEYRNDKQCPLFNPNYDGLCTNYLDEYKSESTDCNKLSIDEIVEKESNNKDAGSNGEETEINYEPIIDFPNFLMHVFRQVDKEVQLNANYLLESYYKIESKIDSPMDFIKRLLKDRCLFDRYIIKSQGEGEEDENLKWKMLKPYMYKKDNSLKFKNTFSRGYDEAAENEQEDDIQKRIIMQQSMLQVTFRNKKYKNWLFDLLIWLYSKDVDNVDPYRLSEYLDKWILDYYKIQECKTSPSEGTDWAFEALGTDTPHFIFNFIDYLYWVAKRNGKANVRYTDEVDDFYFRYYNSVEHHLPQSYEDTGHVNVDNIGNLCLISRRKNSSLNDKAPLEKAKITEPGLQPKRKIMYRITHDSNGIWGKKQIIEHYQDIKSLLDYRESILS